MKRNKINSKGITLIALIIMIVLISILASVGTYSGIQAIEMAKLNRFTAELKIMQTEVNNLYDKNKNRETVNGQNILNIGKEISEAQSQADTVFSQNASGVTEKSGYRYYDAETIKSLNIDDITEEFFVNIEKRSVISCSGFTYQDNTYYTLEQLPNSEYNVEFKKNTEKPTFSIKVNSIDEDKYKVTIEPEYSGNIEKWKVQYKLTTDTNWKTSDDLSFIINKGEYQFKIQNGNIESDIQIQTIGLM